MPLRKVKRNLTYVGMLIATTQEKRKKGGLVPGFYLLEYSAKIQWFFKKQVSIETSVFGTVYMAMKIVIETLRGIRYNMRMIGVPISGQSYIYGYNMSVIYNT